MGADAAIARVLYRSLLRAALRIERHCQPEGAAGEAAARIATRALPGLRPSALLVARTRPSACVRHAFRGAPSGGGIALAPGFEALRLAAALAADLELGEALCKLTEQAEGSCPMDQIERGMWLISARSQAAQMGPSGEDGASSVEQQLQAMVSAAREEHRRLAGQCTLSVTDGGCPFLWVEALNRAVFAVGGFRANSSDYYNPSNSVLSEVFRQRTGLPITCGIVYMLVAHRLGLTAMVQPTNFPLHFLLRLELASSEQCSCVAAGDVATTEPTPLNSEWEKVAGLWVSVDPETGPELFRLQWAPPPLESSNTEDETPASRRAATRWLIGWRISHGRMETPGGLKSPSPPHISASRDDTGGRRCDDDADAFVRWEDDYETAGLGSPPYPPRVRWFKVALPLSAAAGRSADSTSIPGVAVLSASFPDGTEGVEAEEGEFEARLSCRVEVHAADKQAHGKIGQGEVVSAGIGRRRLEVMSTPETNHRGGEGEGTESPRPQPSSVLQLHQVSALDQFFIDPFCAGQLLPDWYLLHQTLSSASAPTRAELLPLLGTASPRTVLSRVLRNLAMAHSQQPNGGDEAYAWSRLADSLKGTASVR